MTTGKFGDRFAPTFGKLVRNVGSAVEFVDTELRERLSAKISRAWSAGEGIVATTL